MFVIPSFFVIFPIISSLLFNYSRQTWLIAFVITFCAFDQIGGVFFGSKLGFLKVFSILSLLVFILTQFRIVIDRNAYPFLLLTFLLLLRDLFYFSLFNDANASFFPIWIQYVAALFVISYVNFSFDLDFKISLINKIFSIFIVVNIVVLSYEFFSIIFGLPAFGVLSANQIESGLMGRVAAYNFEGEFIYRAHSLMNEPKMLSSILAVFLASALFSFENKYITLRMLLYLCVSILFGVLFSASTSGFISIFSVLFFYFSYKLLKLNKRMFFNIFILFFISLGLVFIFYDFLYDLLSYRFYYRIFGHEAIESDAFSGPFMPSELALINYFISNPTSLILGIGYGSLFFIEEFSNFYPIANVGFLYWFSIGGFVLFITIFAFILKSTKSIWLTFSFFSIWMSFAHMESIFFIMFFSLLFHNITFSNRLHS